MAPLVAKRGVPVIVMHNRESADSAIDIMADVNDFFSRSLEIAAAAGIARQYVVLDPGIGFGKTPEHNFELIRRLDVLLALGRPVLVGFSRKSSLRRLVGSDDLLAASVAAAVSAYEHGASILRVHDVRPHVDALKVASAIA
jgi:dihydropteroate synthase